MSNAMLCRHWFCSVTFRHLELGLDHSGSEWDLMNPQGLCVIEDKLLAVADRGAEPSYNIRSALHANPMFRCNFQTFLVLDFMKGWLQPHDKI